MLRGCTVTIEQSFGATKVTKDGVIFARSIEFSDRVKNVGASLVKQDGMQYACHTYGLRFFIRLSSECILGYVQT
jgi:hypothetical protein